MVFGDELRLEQHWRKLIEEQLSGDKRFTVLASKKVVDIVVCRNDGSPIASFLELKLNTPAKPGKRMGIGDPKGEGFQPEIIRKRPSYFERYLRWILCNDTEDTKKYVFATTKMIVEKYIRGGRVGEVGGKQNNISPKIFKEEKLLTEYELLDILIDYLGSDLA